MKLFRLAVLWVLLGGMLIPSASPLIPAVAAPPAVQPWPVTSLLHPTGASNWCVAGSFQAGGGWNNSSDPLYDDGTHGDWLAGDGIYTLDYSIAQAAGTYEWKIFECGTWNGYPNEEINNKWLYTASNPQTVKFLLNTNTNISDDGFLPKSYTTMVVDSAGALANSWTAVGDWQSSTWNPSDPASQLSALAPGLYAITYTVATAKAGYMYKTTETGGWGHQFGPDGRSVNSGNFLFTTTQASQVVAFYADTARGRIKAQPAGTPGTGLWYLRGEMNGWSGTQDRLYDDGTHGDLLAGDGIYTLHYTFATTGTFEFKITVDDWSTNFPPQNSKVTVTSVGQVVRFTLDTNTYNDGWLPKANIVAASDVYPTSWTVVGPWQGWANDAVTTTMQMVAPGLYTLVYTFTTPGAYQFKIAQTGNWNRVYGTGGRTGNTDPFDFQTYTPDQRVQFWLDVARERVAVNVVKPTSHSPDGVIDKDGLYHDSRDLLYRTPFGAVPVGTAVTLRLRAFKDDLTGVRLRVTDDVSGTLTSYPMVLGGSDGTYDYWEYTLPTDHATLLWYRFEAADGTARAYYEDDANWSNQPWVKGGEGKALDAPAGNNYQLTVYLPDYTTPDWLVNGTIYQIFPDRFRNGDPANDVISGTFYYGNDEKWGYPQIYTGTVVHNIWNEQIWDPRVITSPYYSTYSNQFYGGDLQGIIDKLDYLKNAGFTVIYLNPIFQSPSNHKYDATSYETIDPALGTYATFTRLMTETQARGMHVILDGVFNHTSSDSIYMDKYSRYPSLGAYESQASPYYDWYFFNPWPTGYTSWWGYQSLPKLNSANPIVRSYIYSGTNPIATRWIMTGSQPLASGWRFDVAADVDPGYASAPANGYWIGFRNAVRAVYSQTAMISEEWGNASAFLLGNQMDSTMNYRFRNALLGFVRDTGWSDTNSNFPHQTPAQFMETLQSLQEDYPAPAWYAMMNLVGSHDTNRIRFVIRESGDVTATVNARQKLVALAQYSLPGAPTVYYADEVGASADGKPCSATDPKFCGDPYNRLPYPWDDAAGNDYAKEPGILPYYTALGQARLANPALRTGTLDPLLADDTHGLLAYGRKAGSYAALTLFNRNATTQTLALDLFGYLPLGTVLTDVTTLTPYVYTANPFTLTLAGNGGALLVAQDLPETPAAPTLSLTSENDTRIIIHWTDSGATYNVYRSPVSGSGYTRVATDTTGTVFTDTAVINGQKYYYVVTALDAGKLESAVSNEIGAIPHVPVDSYTIVNITPMTMTHTLGIQPTAPISVEIYVAGVTTPTGQGAGLLMELGYGTFSTPNDTWRWTPMTYSGDVGDNDQYVARLTPENANTFYYGARVSADGGRDWAYGLYSSGSFIPGVLTVTASADTTAPAAPTNLRLTHWDIDHLTLAWNAPADPDVYAYDLYRSDSEHAAAVIGRILSPTLVYTDSTVTTGILYTYTVQALDTSFNRSPHSNAVPAMAQQRLVKVTLNVTVPTFTPAGATVCIPGDSAKIMGSTWDPSALPMTQVDATHWQKVLVVPDGTRFQYKYTRCASWDVVEWWRLSDTEHIESTENRALTVEYGTDGNQVVNDTVWNWRDPLVVAYRPANGATGVAVSTVVTATWSRPLAASTVTTASVRLVAATGAVVGAVTYVSQTNRYETVFTPAAALRGTTRYTVTLTADLMGANNDSVKLQQPFSWSFTTGNWIMYLPLVMKNR